MIYQSRMNGKSTIKTDKLRNHFLKDFFRLMLPSLIIFIVFIIIIFSFFTPFIERQHMQGKEDECRHLVEIVIGYLTSVNDDLKQGIISEKTAKEKAIDRIRSLRYGKDTKDYFWIIDKNGVVLMHPFRHDIENVDPELITAPDGRVMIKLMKEMSAIANSNPGGGSLRYIWNRRDETTRVGSKLSYLKKFQPWGWVIGTGVYIDEAEKEIESWKKIFILSSILLGLFSATISLVLSFRAGSLRKKEEEARELLLESEKNLRIREEIFRSIFEKSPHAIVITDISGSRIINANSAFTDMTGYTPDELAGSVPYARIHPLSPMENEKFMSGITMNGVAENIHSTLISKDGNKKDIIYSAIRINYMKEDSILKMIVDLTEERHLEEQLQQSQKMDVLGRLAGGIAHDFNNMLGVIVGSAELLSLRIGPRADEKKYILRILDTGEKAAGLIRKLMLFSRKGGTVSQNFDIHDTVNNVAEIIDHTFDKKIKVVLELKAGSSRITGDPTLMENALLNMAINSRDAMPDGGVITFTTADIVLDEYFTRDHPFSVREGNYIQLNISDTGTGIEQENIKKIFEPFFTTKPSGKGTGLGLSAVYGTIKGHNGTIDVYSEPGKGSIFKIYLPLNEEASGSLDNIETEIIRGNATVLIIDDDRNILSNLEDILTSLGYSVLSSTSGIGGTEIFRTRQSEIDLVICDMIMPGINGIETIKLLKEIRKDVKIIVSSGFYDEETSSGIFKANVSGFIQKPFRVNELSRLIHSVLNGQNK